MPDKTPSVKRREVRSVSGWGARCGCGGESVLHLTTQLWNVTPETSIFLCSDCVQGAVAALMRKTGQAPYWPGDEKRDEPYEAPDAS